MIPRRKTDGYLQIRRTDTPEETHYTLTLIAPGLPGWVVSRATLSDALHALAENLEGRDLALSPKAVRGDA